MKQYEELMNIAEAIVESHNDNHVNIDGSTVKNDKGATIARIQKTLSNMNKVSHSKEHE